MPDPFNLSRFCDAQAGVMDDVRRELAAGQKQSHWMWFVFPQLRGLGRSATAVFYGISGLDEAHAYVADPVLGPRLVACTTLVLALHPRTAHEIFGSPDDLKFHSSMTLFAEAAAGEPVFKEALAKFFEGRPDEATLRRLGV